MGRQPFGDYTAACFVSMPAPVAAASHLSVDCAPSQQARVAPSKVRYDRRKQFWPHSREKCTANSMAASAATRSERQQSDRRPPRQRACEDQLDEEGSASGRAASATKGHRHQSSHLERGRRDTCSTRKGTEGNHHTSQLQQEAQHQAWKQNMR